MIDLRHPASETLYAYEDGGLPAAERRSVERHLNGCAWCRERLVHASELPRALKARYGQEGAPAALRAAVRTQIVPRPGTPSFGPASFGPLRQGTEAWSGEAGLTPDAKGLSWRGGTGASTGRRRIPLRAAIVAAGAFALLLAGVFAIGSGYVLCGGAFAPHRANSAGTGCTPGEPPLLAQLSDAHTRMAQDPTLIQKQGEPAVVAEWFQVTLQQKVHIPALSGLQVSGGRIDSVEGQPAAHVLYQQNGSGAMSLLVWRGAGALTEFTPRDYEGSHVYVGQQGTTTVILWPDNDLRYACVGTAPPDQMLELASHVWRTVSD
jgi:anti-sigma factor RsiW